MSIRSVAVLALLVAQVASAQDQLPQLTLEWTTDGSPETLSADIAGLFVTLHNSGNLTVRQAPLASGFVETLLRDEGVLQGPYLPVELDAMLCDLNPKTCSRRREPAPDRTLRDPAAHVGGYLPSTGNWTAQIGDFLTIPDYSFTPVTTLTLVPAPDGWTARDYVVPAGVDCSAWKTSCSDLVEQFNPPQIKGPAAGQSITVPQLQFQTSIPLRRDERSAIARLINPFPELPGGQGMKSFAESNPTFSAEWRDHLTEQSPTDLTVETLKSGLGPVGTIEPFDSVADEPYAIKQTALFQLVNHPFAKLTELGPELQAPVGIVVFETRISTGHCDLPEMYRPDESLIVPTAVAPDECQEVDAEAQTDADHAIAVAGIIAAKKNEMGIVGFNPAARLLMYEYDRDLPADQQLNALATAITTIFPTDVRVANLSLGVDPIINSTLRNALAIHHSRVLVVAAAGNDGFAMTKENCPILPACLNDLDNVITVVGLNDDLTNPGLWTSLTMKTNSSPSFDIGAPAGGLLTTVTNNRFNLMSGTSFAAPQVAAAASLVFSAGETVFRDQLEAQLSPKVVKDRLIYTADFFPALADDVYAGRLNIGRAINVADAQFILFNGRSVIGQVIGPPASIACRGPGTDGIQPWYDIRRLVYNDLKHRHILFRHASSGNGDRNGELEPDRSCLVNTLSAKVRVQTRIGGIEQVVEFPFSEVRDYTSPLFDE